MKQIIQDLRSGTTSLAEVPAPLVREGHVLVRSHCSLVSVGTEKMLVKFGKSNWWQRAQQQPERVKQVVDKVKTDGVLPTWNAIQRKLDEQIPLGYCNVGEVIEIGKGVTKFALGDRVVSNGAHAEVVCVSENLCARVPDNVSTESAAFTVVGAIALQGIRLAAPTFGETVVVMGMGLLGKLTAALLKANGCEVIALDVDERQLAELNSLGFNTYNNQNDPLPFVLEKTNNHGADAVIITASTTDDALMSQAASLCRKRGRIVLVGVAGLNLKRSDFYEKELSFQVSCSYGPGRYDSAYEQQGLDYPIGFVRWTAQRNFESFLQALSSGKVDVSNLALQRYALHEYDKVYSNVQDLTGFAPLFVYDLHKATATNKTIIRQEVKKTNDAIALAVIGTGNYTSGILLPQLKRHKAALAVICGANGIKAGLLAQKYEVPVSTSDWQEAINNEASNVVVIANRHSQHAAITIQALHKHKHVLVEKPLAINDEQLSEIIETYRKSKGTLMVGYNRRFAPLALAAKKLLQPSVAVSMVMTINAGALPAKHWLHDSKEGGRIIGEVCHFIDLAAYWSHSMVTHVQALALGNSADALSDNVLIHLKFANGSMAALQYLSDGHNSYDKERMELYQNGKILILENWKKLSGFGYKNFKQKSSAQDKGHEAMYKNYLASLQQGRQELISIESIWNTSAATLAAVKSLLHHQPITL